MPFTIKDILTLKDGRRRVWGFFGCFQNGNNHIIKRKVAVSNTATSTLWI